MKSFEDICRMTQNGVKEYMSGYLTSKGYHPINEDGFLYAKGTVPVLLVAHMDTVHKEICCEIIKENGKISSPQGIGGDDRCGIYIIMNLVKELNCSVLLCEDEEIGCIGARKFTKTDYIKDLGVNFMLEFDRKGSNDAVYYNCDNKEFKEFIEGNSFFKEANGSCSDISTLMPVAKLAAVNLSSGYYNPHTKDEYVVFEEMLNVIKEAKTIIKNKCDEPFEYVAKQFNTFSFDSDFDQMSLFNNPDFDIYTELELEVYYLDKYSVEQHALTYGMTKKDCWFDFFMGHPDVCMHDVIDFSFN